MNSKACELLGIEFPLFAFSHCRDVVAGVSAAGGFGVLGAAGHTPQTLEIELDWIDAHVGGKPYGVDLLVPTSMDSKARGLTREELEDRIPIEHKRYIESLLANHDIDTSDLWEESLRDGVGDNMREAGAGPILDVAFSHPIGMVVNALGVPPDFMMSRARAAGVAVGALAGAREHAIKHAEGDHEGAKQLANYFVGQGVGLMNESRSVRSVVYDFMEDFASATERLGMVVAE